MADDIQIYCNCMERVRRHVHIADQVFAGKIDTHNRDLNAELIFLHFRKALEEVAFASPSANREKYSATRAGFATSGTLAVCSVLWRRLIRTFIPFH
jgi:hypothetical protein